MEAWKVGKLEVVLGAAELLPVWSKTRHLRGESKSVGTLAREHRGRHVDVE